MKNLYLDIDGVLLKKDGTPAENLTLFLEYATKNFNCYWLTTHCRDGDASGVFLYLVGKVPEQAIPYIEKIRPTTWNTLKTEAEIIQKQLKQVEEQLMTVAEELTRTLAAKAAWDKAAQPKVKHAGGEPADSIGE